MHSWKIISFNTNCVGNQQHSLHFVRQQKFSITFSFQRIGMCHKCSDQQFDGCDWNSQLFDYGHFSHLMQNCGTGTIRCASTFLLFSHESRFSSSVFVSTIQFPIPEWLQPSLLHLRSLDPLEYRLHRFKDFICEQHKCDDHSSHVCIVIGVNSVHYRKTLKNQ